MDRQPMQILQWNSQSICNKKHDLIYLINKYSPFLVALSETWLRPQATLKFSGYKSIREDRSDGYGGVAIMIKKGYPYSVVDLPVHSVNISVIAVNVCNICFVSIYFPRPTTGMFAELNHILSVLPKPFIVLGDLNCHHKAWGCSKSNYYGEELLKIIDDLNLCILNNGSPTRLTRPTEGKSAIDLSICTPDIASSLSWSTLSSTYGSDHYPIVVNFPFINKITQKHSSRYKYILHEPDWVKFRNVLDNSVKSLPNISISNNVMCAKAFSESVIEAANKTFPIKKESGKISSPPWWDQECSEAIRKRKHAVKTYCQCSTMENFDILSEITQSTRSLLKKKKMEGWKKFCSSLTPQSKSSTVWKNVRRFRSAYSESNNSDICPNLSKKILCQLAPSMAPESILPLANNSLSSTHFPHFTLSELKGILSNVKDSAPGFDDVLYSFLHNMSDNSLNYLLNALNSLTSSGCIPKSWKHHVIIPILKPNKSPSDVSSYRPIALSSVMLKILEHLIKIRLEWFIEHNNLLGQNQYGFRKGKGTIDNISLLVTDIQLAFSNNESVLAAFMDISSAYDNVVISVLKGKLHKLNVPTYITNIIMAILYDRTIGLTNDTTQEVRHLYQGLPQGSVLSPILYNLYSYNLETTTPSNVNILQYADDLLLYTVDKSIQTCCLNLSTSITSLQNYLDKNGLDISVLKSSIVLFSRSKLPPPINICYKNIVIPVKKSVKFLGIVLDNKLTGIDHCDYIVAKCERNINLLRCVSGVWWGAHPFTLKLLYNALIRSLLDYGTFLLEPCNKSGLKKLDTIQSKSLRIILGAMKSSPISAMQVECVEPPLYLRRNYLCDKYFLRVLEQKAHPLLPKLLHLNELMSCSKYWKYKTAPLLVKSYLKFLNLLPNTYQSSINPLFKYPYECLTITPEIIKLDIEKETPCANHHFNNIINNKWSGYHLLFTDASKLDGNVGVGIYHKQYDIVQKIKLPPETSIFTGECYGIFKAVEYIHMFMLKRSIIISDSLSSLQCLQKFPPKSKFIPPIILHIRNLLLSCYSKNILINFAWVPSHCDILGNERADQCAKDAIQCGDMYPYINYCHDIAVLPKVHVKQSWQNLWDNDRLVKGKTFSIVQHSIPTKPWFSSVKLDKLSTSIIIRMRLGHTNTPDHLNRIHIRDNNICECGTDVGDLNHIFFACPNYNHSSFYDNLINNKIALPTSMMTLLSTPPTFPILSVFIVDNNIKL